MKTGTLCVELFGEEFVNVRFPDCTRIEFVAKTVVSSVTVTVPVPSFVRESYPESAEFSDALVYAESPEVPIVSGAPYAME